MEILLHEGHEHAETAANSGFSTELMVLVAVIVLLFAIAVSYGLQRYADA